jgi:hypothetical protein
MVAEEAVQVHPRDDVLDQGQGADVIGPELEAIGLGVCAREEFAPGAAWCGRRGFGAGRWCGHGGSPRGWSEGLGGRGTRGPRGARGRQDGKIFAEINLLELWRLLLT